MGISYRQNPGDVPGMLIATDDDTGQTFPVYDPDMAARLAAGQNPTPEQQQRAADASPMAATPQVADVLKNPTPQAPAPPPQPAPQPQAPEAPLRPNGPNPYDALNQLPQAPGGMVTSKVQVTPDQPGMPYDKVAEEQRGSDLLDRQLALQQQNDQQDMVRDEQKIELGRQREEAKQNADQEQAKADRYTKELQTTVDREINPNRLKENQTLWGSIQGIIGATLAALSSDPNAFGQYTSMMNRRTERDIEAQREQKNSAIDRLTKGLGSAQQAESHYRAKVGELGLQTMTAKLEQLGVREKFEDKLELERKTVAGLNEAARAASFGKPGAVSVEFGQPPPVKAAGVPTGQTGPVTQQLKKLGVSQEQYTKALTSKIGQGGEGAPTVASTAIFVKTLDQDIASIGSLTVKGVMPQKIVVNKLSAGIRDALAAAGVEFGTDGTVDSQQVQQIYTRRLIAEAKRMGGVITENDLKFTERVAGQTPAAVLAWMQRMREDANRELVGTLGAYFPDSTQQVADIMLRGQSSTAGVPSSGPTPFEVQNVADTGPPEATRETPGPQGVAANKPRLPEAKAQYARDQQSERERADREKAPGASGRGAGAAELARRERERKRKLAEGLL